MADSPTVAFEAKTLGLTPSFGFGDRIGLATPGHVAALARAGGPIAPIFAQQSIREMTRTGRTAAKVMADAAAGMRAAGYHGPCGADADHLKTPADVDVTAEAGFVFFTIDPSGEVDVQADNYTAKQVDEKFAGVVDVAPWVKGYRGKRVVLSTGTAIDLNEAVCRKAAVKYGKAIKLAIAMGKHIEKTSAGFGRPFEIELSVDETPQPTTLAEHYIIADQCLKAGMKLVSLAPRFVGDFEKGVDYKGDIAAFEHSLADHAAIAKMLGPYKLSLHSGSDKLSIYGAFARLTGNMFHVKTAGTSYLEALRVAARLDQKLFRTIIEFARQRYDTDKATYHVSASLAGVPAPGAIASGADLETIYLGNWSTNPPGKGLSDPGRQILHCTFGSVLQHAELGLALRQLLEAHRGTYDEILALHFGKHLDALNQKL